MVGLDFPQLPAGCEKIISVIAASLILFSQQLFFLQIENPLIILIKPELVLKKNLIQEGEGLIGIHEKREKISCI